MLSGLSLAVAMVAASGATLIVFSSFPDAVFGYLQV